MPALGGQPLSGGPPPGGEGPPSDAADAYPSSQRRLVTLGICAMLFLMVFRNAGSSDYREEAREYLRAHGREHAIDQVVPKTASEAQLEKHGHVHVAAHRAKPSERTTAKKQASPADCALRRVCT